MSRSGDWFLQMQEEEVAKEYLHWYENRSIEPIKKEKRDDEPRQKFINDETLPF